MIHRLFEFFLILLGYAHIEERNVAEVFRQGEHIAVRLIVTSHEATVAVVECLAIIAFRERGVRDFAQGFHAFAIFPNVFERLFVDVAQHISLPTSTGIYVAVHRYATVVVAHAANGLLEEVMFMVL